VTFCIVFPILTCRFRPVTGGMRRARSETCWPRLEGELTELRSVLQSLVIGGSHEPNQNRAQSVNASQAFIWTSTGGIQDLNGPSLTGSSGWDLECDLAINDNGEIVGYGINPAGPCASR